MIMPFAWNIRNYLQVVFLFGKQGDGSAVSVVSQKV